jgi:transcriptional regulator with XRE-family HTH domain
MSRREETPIGHGNIDVKSIGRRIREIRGFDQNQQEFARQNGISQSQLSKYERGLAPPSTEFLIRLKERFGTSIDWLLTGAK